MAKNIKTMLHLASKIKSCINAGKSGGTFDLKGRSLSFTSGYLVGTYGETIPAISDVLEIRKALCKIYINHKPEKIGFWVNDGKLYIDSVKHIEDRDKAILVGKDYDQISIWDCEAGQEIYLGRKFYTQDNIGNVKYTVSYMDGTFHRDGSPFYGIKTFKSKTARDKFVNELIKQGYEKR